MLPGGRAITVDTLVEGVHWDQRLSPEDVGWKCVAASVSDLAAMGARPEWLVLSLSVPPGDAAWTRRFAHGLGLATTKWDVGVVGGDTTRAPSARMVSVTLGGHCVGRPMVRSGARPGHDLWVTGIPGLAGAGWRTESPGPAALAALRRPTPPLAFALALARVGLPSAAMDLSDGLAKDLPRLCSASAVGAVVDPQALPGHPDLGDAAVDHALRGGDDYQLLLAAPPAARGALTCLARAYGVSVHRIGHARAERRVELSGGGWPTPAFDHFVEAVA